MKKIILLVSAVFCLMLATSGLAVTDTPHPQVLNKIVAVVNNDIITQSDLDQAINQAKQQAGPQGNLPGPGALRNDVLQNLINTKLQLQAANQMNIDVSNDELNQAIKTIADRNRMSIDQLKQMVESHGMPYAQYRKEIKNQMIISRVQQQAIGGQIQVSDKEVNQLIEKYQNKTDSGRMYHVLDIVTPSEEQATLTVNKLKQGAKPEALANGPLQVNDLGWRTTKDLPDLFVKNVAAMKKGDVSGPITAPNGFHVLVLLDSRSTGGSITRDQAREMVFQQKAQGALQTWLKQLRQQAYVKVMD